MVAVQLSGRINHGKVAVVAGARRVLAVGPSWGSSRSVTAGASAAIAVVAVVGVVALTTTGSPTTPARDAAATTAPEKPHYLLPISALVDDGTVPPPTLSGDTGTVGVPAGTAPRPTAPARTLAPDSTSRAVSTYRGTAGTLTPAGIATLALEHGCTATQAPVATAVAMAESGGSPSAQGDIALMDATWDWSAGLWQIRGLRSERGTGALRDSVANQNAATNAAAMYVISSGCSTWSPWTTYTRGLYLGYLGVARPAVAYVIAYRARHGHYPTVTAPNPTTAIPVSTGAGAPAGPTVASTTPAAHPARSSPPAAAPRTTAAAPRSGGGAGRSPSSGPGRPRTSPTPTAPVKTTPKVVPTKVLPSLPLPTSSLPLPLPTLPALP